MKKIININNIGDILIKKHKILKNILLIFLIFSMLITSSGCNNTPEITDTKIIDNDTETESYIPPEIKYDKVKDYQIIKTEKGYRLVFDDSEVYPRVEGSIVAGFPIESWDEFSKRLLSGQLTYSEKTSIHYSFRKDDNGFIILNPYISYKFSHPLADEVDYSQHYTDVTYSAFLKFEEDYIPSLDDFYIIDNFFVTNYTNHLFNTKVLNEKKENIEYERELSNGKKLICFNKTTKKIYDFYIDEYFLSDGEKQILISKAYYNTPDKPCNIYISGFTKDNLCFVAIYDSKYDDYYNTLLEYSTEILTDEFLFGFDVEAVEKT